MTQTRIDNYSLARFIPQILGPYASVDSDKRLYSAYTEPWRTYHNASHIVDMYTTFQTVVEQIDPRSLVSNKNFRMAFILEEWQIFSQKVSVFSDFEFFLLMLSKKSLFETLVAFYIFTL